MGDDGHKSISNAATAESIPFTDTKTLEGIRIYDSTVEIVGYVDGIDAPSVVGENQSYRVFKFYLNNGDWKRVQIVTWNDEIDRVVPHVQCNHIIHIDGGFSRQPKVARFNGGNVPYEINVRSNTVINCLGKYEPPMGRTGVPTSLTNIKDVASTLGYIRAKHLRGLTKAAFSLWFSC